MAQLRVYNTLSRSVEPFEPMNPGQVRMYVCGMTVYDYCHIGHARAMMTFDVVYRWLLERKFDVTYVRNYTDVDDKIIVRANELGEDPLALSQRFIQALNEDLEGLGLLLPNNQPKVSEHIDDIVTLIGTLMDNGHAYAVGADVFYDVTSFVGYGKLSGKKLEDLRSGERVQVDDRKRNPGDFALWKSVKPGEPFWPSPWGDGRPGWHIECSAMSMRYLGESFDIHGGGIDLVFPHHENEIAQSEGAHPAGHEHPFAKYWLHNGHLTLEHEKMSKSLGNMVTIRNILNVVPAEALRLFYQETHYRSPLPYSSARLGEAMVALDRLYHGKELLEEMSAMAEGESAEALAKGLGGDAHDLFEQLTEFESRFSSAMDDDFNTAQAIGVVYSLVRAVNRFGNQKKWLKRAAAFGQMGLESLSLVDRALGIGGMDAQSWFKEVRIRRLQVLGRTEQEVENLIEARKLARQNKDWAAADHIRDELMDMGVVVMDTPDGTNWRMKLE